MINMTTFIKIGDRLINPAQIILVDLNYEDPDHPGVKGIEITLTDATYPAFWGQEAEILRDYFLSGSRVYDLNSLYGQPPH